MQFLTRVMGWFFACVLGLLAVLLMVGSREPAVVQLALVPGSVELPLFAAILIAALIGFFCGAVVMWFSDGRWRRLARDEMAELEDVHAENERLKQELADARMAADAAEATQDRAYAGNDNRQVALVPDRAL